MTVEKDKLRDIKKMYKQGKSVASIARYVGVSTDAMFYFFRKNHLERRSGGEINRARFENKKPSFIVKPRLTRGEEKLKMAGIMLYWGEGSKWSGETIVDFANSDPAMIRIFLKFLRQICRVNESKLRVYLYCYRNQKIDELNKFWQKVTKIKADRFTKPYVRKDYKLSKSGKMRHGLIHIRYYDKKLLIQIKKWIEEYIKKH